jgi:hypothetical protein
MHTIEKSPVSGDCSIRKQSLNSRLIHRLRYIKVTAIFLALFTLVGCPGDSPNTTDDTTTVVTTEAELSLALTDNAAQVITTISSGSPATATVTVTNTAGVVANAVVTFTTDNNELVLLTPSSGTALTNESGVAIMSLSSANLTAAGAATLTATTQVGTEAVSQSIDFAVIASPPTLSIALTDSAAQTITTISSGSPATATVTVTDPAGAAVERAVVTFSVDTDGLTVLTPSSGTALTNASGVATVSLESAGLTSAGAATLTATTQVGTEAVSQSIGFAVGAASVTISSLTFGVGMTALSAYGSTSVSVSVSIDGVLVTTPQAVSFTSSCTVIGKAELTADVITVGGVALASYLDNGCAGNDTVTASVSGITTASETLAVTPPTAGSIQFDAVSPSNGFMNLKGVGGQESALVTFKVVDSSGNPIGGKDVTFSLNTSVGGITFTPNSAVSDPLTGNVVVSVQSGSIATPVRVSAMTGAGSTTLTSQSSRLLISTGIPDQQNFSLSATEFNIEGWNFDGVTTTLTARLADHFNNPVLDGTAVSFIAEGGSIEPGCFTENGVCSVVLTSQNLRPDNGRVTVLAYAIGEEGFTDFVVPNGQADGLPEMFDANGNSTDMPEAFLDINENGTRDLNEAYQDFNGDSFYSVANGEYNGVLCDPSVAPGSTPTACNTQKTIHVRNSIPIIFSSSSANIDILDIAGNPLSPIVLPPCTASVLGSAVTFKVKVLDENRNSMPVGSTINFSADNGTILSPRSYVVENTAACNTGGACPASKASASFGEFDVVMASDTSVVTPIGGVAACDVDTGVGGLTVTVSTPGNRVTTAFATVTD